MRKRPPSHITIYFTPASLGENLPQCHFVHRRKQRTDIGKYSFVNRTIQLWNQLPADALGALSCKPNNFRKRVRKAINKAK
jgi:hypothetical protein